MKHLLGFLAWAQGWIKWSKLTCPAWGIYFSNPHPSSTVRLQLSSCQPQLMGGVVQKSWMVPSDADVNKYSQYSFSIIILCPSLTHHSLTTVYYRFPHLQSVLIFLQVCVCRSGTERCEMNHEELVPPTMFLSYFLTAHNFQVQQLQPQESFLKNDRFSSHPAF